MNHPVYISKQ